MGLFDSLVEGLTPQNGYQSSVPLDTSALNQQIATSQGNFNNLQSSQNDLAKALLAQSQGQGPNPAQQQLNQATNQNINQNAGFIASQKGINPALAQRMAAQNAAQTSQQAAGQAGIQQAQQQLASQNQLQNLYGNQANQNLQSTQTSGSLANQASLGAQQIQAGVSAQNAAANQSTAGGLLGGIGGAISSLFDKGGEVGFDGGGQVSASQQIANNILAQAGVHVMPQGGNSNTLAQSIQTGANALMKPSATGMSSNDVMNSLGSNPLGVSGVESNGPVQPSMLGVGALPGAQTQPMQTPNQGALGNYQFAKGGMIPQKLQHFAAIYHPHLMAQGGKVNAKVSPGEMYLSPKDAKKTAEGKENPLKHGKVFKGTAEVSGDSPKNDKIPTKLEEGGFVIPRSIMQSDDPAEAAKRFVADKLKEHGQNPKEDFQEALKRAISGRKNK